MKTFEDFYVKKDYSNALQTLEKHANVLPAGLLHYNLGTVYLRMENWALARYHFLRADNAGFSRTELQQNMQLVEERLELSRLEHPLNSTDFIIKGALVVQNEILTSLSLILLVAGLIVLRKSASVLKVVLWSFIVILPIGLSYGIGMLPKYIVTEPLVLADGPSAIFDTTGELPAGVMVIVKTKDDWKEIIYPSRFTGWVKASGLKKLE